MASNSQKAGGLGRALHLGLDVGSVHARAALVEVGEAGPVVALAVERISGGPAAAVERLLDRLGEVADLELVVGAGLTGSGRELYAGMAGWQVFSSPYAAIAGVLVDRPDTRTIIQIGGQSAFVVGLEGGIDRPWRVSRSPLCAAGTGRFLEQQAYRLGISIEEFGARALDWTASPPRIAARCSVFAKSDLIHLQQKGWAVSAMLAGLSDSVARMIRSQWREEFTSPVVFVGGVAANPGVVRALGATLGVPVEVPPDFDYREALGAARLVTAAAARPVSLRPSRESSSTTYFVDRRLLASPQPNGWKPAELDPAALVDCYLGVDVGSTSTKAAVIDARGELLAKSYLMTAGQPLEAVKQVMANLAPMVEGRVHVLGVGVTGSGRYLVGAFVGADLIKNEITAQTRAALHLDPTIDTVFELGGQDSKYVYLENGTALDYQMNKACAAGTGSFIDELAEQLGISTRSGEFARRAFAAEHQLDLGERCAAFMSQSVTSAQHAGVASEVIVSSLSTSLAKNYRSKVVGNRRVGRRVFLTGAVFYNEAAVAAFQSEFPDRTFIVPEHKEVTGAIGAALLAKEGMDSAASTRFPGFSKLAEASYTLRSFTCRHCENACAISAMTTDSGDRLYYGSRCDRYDARGGEVGGNGRVQRQQPTPFDERERLLFGEPTPSEPPVGGPAPAYPAADAAATTFGDLAARPSASPTVGGGLVPLRGATPAVRSLLSEGARDVATAPLVGVPRALMTLDLAPLLVGFLESLGVRTLVSSSTSKRTIEKSVERAYTDSCFPIKILHGHVEELLDRGVDYVLIPNAIRMGRMDGDEDQRYSCPLVQAAPYIVSSVFGLGKRLLDPVIDLSKGDEATVESFAEVAERLGLDRRAGRDAARAGLARQRDFEAKAVEAGRKLLADLAEHPEKLGLVLLSRAYNAQDAGANLGIAAELDRLGAIPIPLDYLPLDEVDVREISDRPYWNYERKLLAAAKLIADRPNLFGLFLSNFGCGPNSIVQNIVEDIMGAKPLGQIEVDEHAAEAGYVTRLEALVDTIQAYRRAGRADAGDPKRYVRRVPTAVRAGQQVLLPRMADHAEVVAAAMRSYGVAAEVLPESDESSMGLSRDVTSGKECLPFRDTLGVFLRMARDGTLPPNARALMAGSFGPCRLGKYAQEQQKILDELGIPLTIMTTVSNNAYGDLGLGTAFELLAWRGIVAVDQLDRLLWLTRPYEKRPGEADRAYARYVAGLARLIEERQPIEPLMREATATFLELRDPSLPRRPLVGINGEIYLRANRFCNKDLVGLCEANGLEVEVAPLGEWFRYTGLRNVEDAWTNRDLGRLIRGSLRRLAMQYYGGRVSSWFRDALKEPEPGPTQLLEASARYLPSRNGSEAVLSLGSGALQLASSHYAGVISVMPHGCMPGGIVAAIAQQVSREHSHKPWIALTYDGFADKVNPERVADLAEQVKRR